MVSLHKNLDSEVAEFNEALRRREEGEGAQFGLEQAQGGLGGSSSLEDVVGEEEEEDDDERQYQARLREQEQQIRLEMEREREDQERLDAEEEQYSDGEETDMEELRQGEHDHDHDHDQGRELEASVGTAISLLLPLPDPHYLSQQQNLDPSVQQQSFDFRQVREQEHHDPRYSYSSDAVQRAGSYQYLQQQETDEEEEGGGGVGGRMGFYDREDGQPDHETPPTSTSSDVESKQREADAVSNLDLTRRRQRNPIIAPQYQDHSSSSSPFIPALSHPRSAHLRRAYPNENTDEREYISSRRTTASSSHLDQHNYEYEPEHSISRPIKRLPSPKQLPWIPPNGTPATATASSSSSTTTTKKRATPRTSSSKPKIEESYSVASSSTSGGAPRKRTEIPAVEDDPSVKPYGCAFPSCLARLESGRDPYGPVVIGAGRNSMTFVGESWFRTVKELREHCWIHKKAGEVPGETPFRCALDPCGKSFKVRSFGSSFSFAGAQDPDFFSSLPPNNSLSRDFDGTFRTLPRMVTFTFRSRKEKRFLPRNSKRASSRTGGQKNVQSPGAPSRSSRLRVSFRFRCRCRLFVFFSMG